MNPELTEKTNEVAPTKTTMTPQEINKRIAIACGWKLLPNSFPPNSRLWEHPSGKRAYEPDDLPNYHGDLNAMHAALREIKAAESQFRYAAELLKINGQGDLLEVCDLNVDFCWITATATAAQRAEAFLRTIGKWEEVE
jgi:hypothetical protein